MKQMNEVNKNSKYAKTDIVNNLARKIGYKSYLELCTPSTGNFFKNIDSEQFLT